MDAKTWELLSQAQKEELRDLSDLNPQLTPFFRQRVEVVTDYGETRRFLVGRSTGWKPCCLEVKTIRSFGGVAAEKHYKSVKLIRKAR